MLFLRHIALVLLTIAVSAPSQADTNKCNAFDAIDVDINRDGQMDLAIVEEIGGEYNLHVFLTPEARELCVSDYSINLITIPEEEIIYEGVLSLNSRGSLVVHPYWNLKVNGSSSALRLYTITLRFDGGIKVIGYDHWRTNWGRPTLGLSVNFLNGTALLRTIPAFYFGEGFVEERPVEHDLRPFLIPNGAKFAFPKEFLDWEDQQYSWFRRENDFQ